MLDEKDELESLFTFPMILIGQGGERWGVGWVTLSDILRVSLY